ncbi:MAG: class I SAM-dependent methyltransferase [Gammaproteobacteria bacterium]|nr:class I SAM-dependent methyltransferase [Gammaproteobacteria bacterium]MBU1775284.1 class I SAM-dependent methyltransferase [Gammaproteobacteria bacterium]MBU1968440.1 class I SAM-dependent methyltransferase [Gammaproteobacteria bacterium]
MRQLHRQAFVIPGAKAFGHYTVVCCEDCGFVYADDIPPQPVQDDYYESSGRHLHAAKVPAGLAEAHKAFFDFITAHLPRLAKEAAILDIGSSMGHFLNLFRQSGHRNLLGLEPSAAASELAKETYDIEVVPAALEDFQPGKRFSLISMCGVLEHLVALDEALGRMDGLLAQDGHVFIAVPDAGSFGAQPPREPFLEFALEHINFFTGDSLDNLFGKHGLKRVAAVSQWNDFYANRYLLVLYARGEKRQWITDPQGAESVARYVRLSQEVLSSVAQKIAVLADSGVPLIVWGAGSLAQRLCATTRLPECNLLAFVDSNVQLLGSKMLDIPIHAPGWIDGHRDASILVASYVYGKEIRDRLSADFDWKAPIILI